MKTVTIRDFRTRPRSVRQALSGEREAILTANGQPIALLVPVDAATVDETAAAIRRARAMRAVQAIRRKAAGDGTDRLTMREIDAEIAAVRSTRSARARRTGRA
ncbi:MAG: type II toxin-antitoxin system Phd/YefM family antitoxin [Reyranellaceae bacterium]